MTLIGLMVETVVRTVPDCPSKSPIWVRAIPREAVDGRHDFGETEIRLRVVDGGLLRPYESIRPGIRLSRVGELFPADDLLLRERRVAF